MPRIEVNGYDLFYADDNFAPPWTYPDVVFLQSYRLGNHAHWWGWMPQLAKHFRVLRLDRRGNGLSQKPARDYALNVDDLLSDFEKFLDRLGIEQIHYIGESLGGVLGAAFAARYPDRVKSLVLCHTPYQVNAAIQAGWVATGYEDGPASVLGLGSWAYAHRKLSKRRAAGASETDVSDLELLWRAENEALIPAHVNASLMRMASDPELTLDGMLDKIHVPTLLITPSSGSAIDAEEQAMMRTRIADCSQVVFDRSSDGFTWKDPSECAAAALEFLLAHCQSPSD